MDRIVDPDPDCDRGDHQRAHAEVHSGVGHHSKIYHHSEQERDQPDQAGDERAKEKADDCSGGDDRRGQARDLCRNRARVQARLNPCLSDHLRLYSTGEPLIQIRLKHMGETDHFRARSTRVQSGHLPGGEIAQRHRPQVAALKGDEEEELCDEPRVVGDHVVGRVVGMELPVHLAHHIGERDRLSHPVFLQELLQGDDLMQQSRVLHPVTHPGIDLDHHLFAPRKMTVHHRDPLHSRVSLPKEHERRYLHPQERRTGEEAGEQKRGDDENRPAVPQDRPFERGEGARHDPAIADTPLATRNLEERQQRGDEDERQDHRRNDPHRGEQAELPLWNEDRG